MRRRDRERRLGRAPRLRSPMKNIVQKTITAAASPEDMSLDVNKDQPGAGNCGNEMREIPRRSPVYSIFTAATDICSGTKKHKQIDSVRFNEVVRVRFIPTRCEMRAKGILQDVYWSKDDFRGFQNDFLELAWAVGIVPPGGGACMLRLDSAALDLTAEAEAREPEKNNPDVESARKLSGVWRHSMGDGFANGGVDSALQGKGHQNVPVFRSCFATGYHSRASSAAAGGEDVTSTTPGLPDTSVSTTSYDGPSDDSGLVTANTTANNSLLCTNNGPGHDDAAPAVQEKNTLNKNARSDDDRNAINPAVDRQLRKNAAAVARGFSVAGANEGLAKDKISVSDQVRWCRFEEGASTLVPRSSIDSRRWETQTGPKRGRGAPLPLQLSVLPWHRFCMP